MGAQPSKKNCFDAYGCISSVKNTNEGKIYNINGKNGDVHKIHIANDGSVKHLGITGKNGETRPFTANDHLNNSTLQRSNNNTKNNNTKNNNTKNKNTSSIFNTIGSLTSPVGKSVQNHPIVQQAKNTKTILSKYASTNKAKNAKKLGIGLNSKM
jgi:hypothetical protein